MTLLQCSTVDERVAVLEANSIFLGFVHATANKTLKVEEMLFSSTTFTFLECILKLLIALNLLLTKGIELDKGNKGTVREINP